MTTAIDTYIEELKQLESRLKEYVDKKAAMPQEEFQKWVGHVKELQKDAEDYRRSKIASMDDYGRIMIREGRYAGLTALELALVRNILAGRAKINPRLVRSESWEALDSAQKALRGVMTLDSVEKWVERCLKQRNMIAQYEGPGSEKFRNSLYGWRQVLFAEIRKALDSTTAGSGDELVPTLEAAELWMDVNLQTKVLPLFTQSPMPSNPFDIPLQFGDLNWYPTAENEAVTTTTPSTGKTTLTAYELKGGVPFSDTLEEDSIVALVPELRSNLARNAAEVIDDILLNADTTQANNINNDGVTTTKSTVGKAHFLIGFDGLYHLPYVDNTAQRIRVAGALANTTFNNLALKLGRFAAPSQRGDVVFVVTINVGLKALQLAQVETIEKYGPRATISSGELTSIYGTPLIMSEQFVLVDTTGAVRNASSNNTTGRILAVNTTQWRVGFRRSITFEPDREPGKSQTTLYVSFRIAFTERTGTRSSATHTAAAYDISSVT